MTISTFERRDASPRRRRVAEFVRVVLIACIAGLMGYGIARQRHSTGVSGSDPYDSKVNCVFDSVDFENAKLADVLTALTRRADLSLVFRSSSSEDGFGSVTAHLKNVTFADAINSVLNPTNAPASLDWTESNQTVVIVDRAQFIANPDAYRWQFYDVKQILSRMELFASSSDESNELKSIQPHESEVYREEMLKKLIIDTVDPKSWEDNGGPVGQIDSFSGQLVIHQTPQNHQAIQALLRKLKQQVH